MKFDRSSGILLHISSLPGKYGIGDFGKNAYKWIDFLSNSGCAYWQILPHGPTGYENSPYQCFSSVAGNHYLISPELLIEDNFLSVDDLEDLPDFEDEKVDFGVLIPWKLELLNKAFQYFLGNSKLETEFGVFVEQEKNWLNNFALFMAIKERHQQVSWVDWPEGLRDRQPKAIESFCVEYSYLIQKHKFFQFLFFYQYIKMKNYAFSKNIEIVGDLPIYVAHDSSDVWANPDLFYLDDEGNPTVVAGVPPDGFSPDGQLWGNPIYDWERHSKTDYKWWTYRIGKLLEIVDVIRVDHFKGFVDYWQIPADSPTAKSGEWIIGPGDDLFVALKNQYGELPIVVEDLGEMTQSVYDLRDNFNFPGMKILQSGFNGDENHPFLPHMYPENCAAYTGTHDNDPIMGWYDGASENERRFSKKYLDRFGMEMPWSMINCLWESPAIMVFVQMQDVLELGKEFRMNIPSTTDGNWEWRMRADNLTEELSGKIKELNDKFDR